jgi:hypothetical protein
MIQRIQSIWLFVAAFISGALFIFPLYHFTIGTGPEQLVGARNDYMLLIMATLMTVLPLIALFLFRNRKRQKGFCWLSMLSAVGFIAVMLMKIQNLKNATPPPSSDNFALPGPVIPVLVIVCIIMALRGIRKDEALIRSVDRLR